MARGGGVPHTGPSTGVIRRPCTSFHSRLGGAAGVGGLAGLGKGGGLYLSPGGVACLDDFTQAHTRNNHATSDYDDIFLVPALLSRGAAPEGRAVNGFPGVRLGRRAPGPGSVVGLAAQVRFTGRHHAVVQPKRSEWGWLDAYEKPWRGSTSHSP